LRCNGRENWPHEKCAFGLQENRAVRSRRWTLPIAFLGIAETKWICLGTLKSARRVLQYIWSSCALAAPWGTTTAETSSPYLGSDTPKTAASATAGSSSN